MSGDKGVGYHKQHDNVKLAAAISFGETAIRKSPAVIESILTNVNLHLNGQTPDWNQTATLFGQLIFDSAFASVKTAIHLSPELDELELKEFTKQVVWGGWRVLLSNI